MKYSILTNFIEGKNVSVDGSFMPVFSPATGARIAEVPLSGQSELDAAVRAAQAAFPGWSTLPIKERVQVFYRYKVLLEQNMDELAALIMEENGKIKSEAMAEVLKIH